MQGKNATIKSSPPYVVEDGWVTIVGILNLGKEVYYIISLAKIILYIVVLCGYAQLDKLVLEGPALFKEAMHLACYLHIILHIQRSAIS